jgi:hypothetical protein
MSQSAQFLKKHKIKVFTSLVFFVFAFAGLFFISRPGTSIFRKAPDPRGVWEVMVVLRSQEGAATPEEDAKNNLKRGDAIAVRPQGHAWSETENKSYLLVRIDGKKSEVEKLLEPLEKETGEKDAEGRPRKETVRLRRHAVDINQTGFTGDQTVSGQPLEDKVFGPDIIIEKS